MSLPVTTWHVKDLMLLVGQRTKVRLVGQRTKKRMMNSELRMLSRVMWKQDPRVGILGNQINSS
jgi:hypothetical protein